MEFLKGVPNIILIKDNEYIRNINTVIRFDEDEDRVILQCAENIKEFQRGLVCDLECAFFICNSTGTIKADDVRNELIKDLVLVYINKSTDMDRLPQFEYVFYK